MMRLASALRCLAALAVLAAAAAQYGFDLAEVQRSVSTQTARAAAQRACPKFFPRLTKLCARR